MPIFLSKSNISRYKFIISFVIAFCLTIILLLNIYLWQPFMLTSAILITCYAFIPVILSLVICIIPFNRFLKTGICLFVCSISYYYMGFIVNKLFKTNENYYDFDFNNWNEYINANISFICLSSLLFLSVIFIGIGIYRVHKKKKFKK